jgi:GNAT superfamily N-acetyltransferase
MHEPFQTSVPGLELRFAGVGDCGLILDFIRQLADYERMTDDVVADEQTIRESLFDGRTAAEVIIAELDGEAAGFGLFFHNFSTFLGRPGIYLEDLFVRPELRGRGIGGAVLVALARLARERGCGRLEWSVLNWNEPAIAFYEHLGARPMDGWTVYRLDGGALEDLASRSSR